MLGCISKYAVADLSTVRSVADINVAGRREQDKQMIREKEMLEKEKQAKMRRAKVSIDEIRDAAKNVIPDNELSPYSEDDLARRKVTTELTTKANWDGKSYQVMKAGMLAAFPLNTYTLMDRPKIRIKNKSNMSKRFIGPYLANVKKLSEKILVYMFGLKGSRTNNPKKNTVTDLIDVMSIFFVNYRAGSEVDQSRKLNKARRVKVIENLVQTVKKVNTHYNTTKSNTNVLGNNDTEEGFYL